MPETQKKIYGKIKGTGSYLPERIQPNAELERMVETSDQWIIERTGICQRHIMADHETTSSMSQIAAERALEAAGIKASEIDLIIVGTSTPDRFFPSTACILQQRLGIKNEAPAFDIGAACSGFIYALTIANQFVQNGTSKKVLVVGADALTRIVDWTDRSTCILFSDGAGAVVLEASSEPGVMSAHIHCDGSYNHLLYAPNHLGELEEPPYIRMQGGEVFKLAVGKLEDMVNEALAANQLTKKDIDWLIPHQANLRIIKATAKKLNLTMDRVIITIQDQGNTSAASIPLALDQGIRDGRIKRGETLLLEAFGAGFSWGSVLIRY